MVGAGAPPIFLKGKALETRLSWQVHVVKKYSFTAGFVFLAVVSDECQIYVGGGGQFVRKREKYLFLFLPP